MTGVRLAPGARGPALPLGAATVVALLLVAATPGEAVLFGALTIAGVLLSAFLCLLPADGRPWALLPALGVAGIDAARAPLGLPASILAGALGIALLLAAASAATPSVPGRRRLEGLALPGLSVLLAILVGVVLPTEGSGARIASVVVAGALIVIALGLRLEAGSFGAPSSGS